MNENRPKRIRKKHQWTFTQFNLKLQVTNTAEGTKSVKYMSFFSFAMFIFTSRSTTQLFSTLSIVCASCWKECDRVTYAAKISTVEEMYGKIKNEIGL